MPPTLGERAAQARREKGVRERRDITQAMVAKAVGVSGATISDMESGKKVPGEAILAKVASFLGVTPAFLRYGVPMEPSSGEAVYGGQVSDADAAAAAARRRAKLARQQPPPGDPPADPPQSDDPPMRHAAGARRPPRNPRGGR